MTKFINGCDMPEHVQKIIRGVIMDNSTASFTTTEGQAIVISKEEYDRLTAEAAGEFEAKTACWMDSELDAMNRREIDY